MHPSCTLREARQAHAELHVSTGLHHPGPLCHGPIIRLTKGPPASMTGLPGRGNSLPTGGECVPSLGVPRRASIGRRAWGPGSPPAATPPLGREDQVACGRWRAGPSGWCCRYPVIRAVSGGREAPEAGLEPAPGHERGCDPYSTGCSRCGSRFRRSCISPRWSRCWSPC